MNQQYQRTISLLEAEINTRTVALQNLRTLASEGATTSGIKSSSTPTTGTGAGARRGRKPRKRRTQAEIAAANQQQQ